MNSQNHDPDRHARDVEFPDEHPGSGRAPVYFRPNPAFGHHSLRESYVNDLTWPLGHMGFEEARHAAEARYNLEQVGHILHRLELDQADIIQLRTETRAILAGLAA